MRPWERLYGMPWHSLRHLILRAYIEELPPHDAEALGFRMDERGIGCADRIKAEQLAELLPVHQHAWTSQVVAVLHSLWVWRVGSVHNPDVCRCDYQQRMVDSVLAQTQLFILAFQFGTNLSTVAAQGALITSVLGLSADKNTCSGGPWRRARRGCWSLAWYAS